MNTGLVIISLCACKCYSLRCLPQKGRTKEHVIVQPTLSFLPTPPLCCPNVAPPPPPPFFSSLLLSLRCTTFITNHHPTTTRHLLLARSPISRSPPPSLPSSTPYYPTTFASLTIPSVPSSLTRSLARSLFFLCSSLNYWKQNGLKTKTQADVA